MTLNMLSKQSASERDSNQHVVILHGESGAGLPDRTELVIHPRSQHNLLLKKSLTCRRKIICGRFFKEFCTRLQIICTRIIPGIPIAAFGAHLSQRS